MRKSKFSEPQIVGILQDAEAGVAVNDLLRTHGISRATFFKLGSCPAARFRPRSFPICRSSRRTAGAPVHRWPSRERRGRGAGSRRPGEFPVLGLRSWESVSGSWS